MDTDPLHELDVAAKARLLTGATFFTLHGDPTIGLAEMAFSDGPTGVRGVEFSGGPLTCLLPNATLLAGTWSEDVAHEVGALLADEAERQQIHVVLGPTINLHRSPLGGRLFEAYSEDPLLTGRFAAAYVRGLQERNVGACLKHLVANEAETDRHTVSSNLDERTLREVYLLPFEIAVAEADPWSIMAAYNDVNGTPSTEHGEINNRIVKDEWGWTGLLMSDWFAAKSAAPAANGGLDLVMPGPLGPWGDALVQAVEDGEVPLAVLDDHVRRLLLLADRVGALGERRQWRDGLPEPDGQVRRDQLTRLAASGMVMLRNGGALPLGPTTSVALIGRPASDTVCMGGGSAAVRAPYQVSVVEGLQARLGERLTTCDGVGIRTYPRAAKPGVLTDPVTGRPGMRVRRYAADGHLLKDDVIDEASTILGIDPSDAQVRRLELSAEVPGGAQTVGFTGVGDWTLRIDGDAVGSASLRLTTGDVDESVLRPPGWQTDVSLPGPTLITAELVSDLGFGRIGLVAEPTPPTDDEAITTAVRAAAEADVAVVVVGLTEEQETEAVDKMTLVLPGRQDDLVFAVASVARRTVVVVNAATPVLMPWRDEVDAILIAGLPGQEGGHAVAAALLNEIEPSGRLVTSYPVADGATRAWNVTPTDGVLSYDEGTFIGYRGHTAGLAPAPAYWFGDGLGYGRFTYGPATVEGRTVTVPVTNTAPFDSREVVQVYLAPQQEGQPVRLVGWAAAKIPAGGEVTITVECDERLWRTWDTDSRAWQVLSGGELLIGRGLGDVRHKLPAE